MPAAQLHWFLNSSKTVCICICSSGIGNFSTDGKTSFATSRGIVADAGFNGIVVDAVTLPMAFWLNWLGLKFAWKLLFEIGGGAAVGLNIVVGWFCIGDGWYKPVGGLYDWVFGGGGGFISP